MPTLTIDNRKIEVAEGTTLLDASRAAGVCVRCRTNSHSASPVAALDKEPKPTQLRP